MNRCQRQPQARIAGSGLNDGAAGFDLAVAFGGFDHAQADAILDRARRVVAFEFGEEFAGAGIQVREFHQRRVADQVENVSVSGQWGRAGH